ncbi:MAG: glycerophosphodiester phosphodiesterase [Candidatus Binatia bacterium]
MPPSILAIGHRGAAAHMPENTMPSFERALELGADALEFDVAISRDGVPLVIHDDTLDRTTSGRGLVEHHTMEELRALDAGRWKGVPTHLPTLAEVLDAFAARTLLNLEIKSSPRRAELVDACAHAVAERNAAGAVVFSSFDHDALRLLRHVLPEARIGVLCEMTGLERALACAAEIGAENVHPPIFVVTKPVVERAHDAALKVWTWTVNQPETITHAIALGVDGIFSDFPERVVALRAGA